MKVVHICTQIEQGGAARATLNLHLGLRGLGIESTVLSLSEFNTLPYCENYPCLESRKDLLKEVSRILAWKNRTKRSNTHFSIDLFGCNISTHPLVYEADVLNLHWTSEFLSSVSITELAALHKPLLWTLHDMRPLTGGCHFSAGCNRFEEACGQCPQLSEEPLDFTARSLSAMSSAVAVTKPVFIAPSQWMLQNIQKSRVSRESASCCIPYGVDSNIFKPLLKEDCRSGLNLDKDAWYILFATHGFQELRKGVAHALAILDVIARNTVTAKEVATGKMRILCCGADANHFTPVGWQVERLGYVSADKMPLFYNSADVLLFTSLEDNLPNVILEAMACGTPVVAPRIGGVPDLLSGEVLSCCLFNEGNAEGAGAMMIALFQNNSLHKELSSQSIEKIRQDYSIEKQASAYLKLYTELIIQSQPEATLLPMLSCREGSGEALFFALDKIKANRKNPKSWNHKFWTLLNKESKCIVILLIIIYLRNILI